MEINKYQGVLIRGMAILSVVAYHFQYDMFGGSFLIERGQGLNAWISDIFIYLQQEPSAFVGLFMSFCFIGVNVFFLLSGYALAKKFAAVEKVVLWDMRGQILKILIPYWLAHPIIHVIDWILKNLQYQVGLINYETYFAGMHSFSQYLESFILLPRWFSNEGALMFDGTWWFVGVIIQFYLLFPLLWNFFKRLKPLKALIVCLAISFLYRFVISLVTDSSPIGVNEANILLFINFPARLSEFALGMYLAQNQNCKHFFSRVSYGFILILAGFVTLSTTETMFISDFLFASGGIVLLYRMTFLLNGAFKTITAKVGENSYLIYLYHEPPLKLVLKFLFPNWIS